ncbi:MAG: tetratricopeptide repeat protein [Planctomycetaceae bacterium]
MPTSCRISALLIGPVAFVAVLALDLCLVSYGGRIQADDRYFEGLGQHRRSISTRSPEAQTLFNQGLAFLYSFNHDESIRSFRAAAAHDPQCAAIHWAIALANGPHINFPFVDPEHAAAAGEAMTLAKRFAETASPVERDLIDALAARYANPQPEDRRPLDVAYAEAMRKVWKRYPHDPDVGAMFAESLMDLWPWDLWTADGQMKDDTSEILQTLEKVFGLQADHPLALHLYVHALEGSPYPERAALAADRLRDLQPGLGHMVHMPSHIDVRLGQWQRAIDANEKAIKADAVYRGLSPEQNFFRNYMAHNHHMLAFAAMMLGQEQRSTDAINQMLKEIPEDWLEKNAIFADGMFAMPFEVHIRFGRWNEILAEPEPPAILPIARAFRHFARGVAYAALNKLPQSRSEQQLFLEAKQSLPKEAMFVMNPAEHVLAVAASVLEGEILYREGQVDQAIAALEQAVRSEEQLRYIEPPDWIQPVRHVLGATLMDAKRYAEAEQVYRADLQRHPNNGWSLHGLATSLKEQGKADAAAAVFSQFSEAWKHADTELSSSCFCLPGRQPESRNP